MKKSFIKILLLVVVGLFVFVACEKDPEPSLYDPNFTGKETPVISKVTPDPSKGALAGVTNVTIEGSNFSNIAEKNVVSFSGAIAQVLEASENQLVVKAPNFIKDSVDLKVAVEGALNFSNSIIYKLVPAVAEYFELKDFEIPYAITTDADENIYLSLVSSNTGQGIMKISPDGNMVNWASKGGETFYNDIKMGADNTIYGVRTVRAIFAITEGNSPVTFGVLPTGVSLITLDIDANGNIWTGGSNTDIYSVKPDKAYKAFAFDAEVKSLRVFDGALYAAAIKDSINSIFKFNIIDADNLGAAEVYFEIPDEFLADGNFEMQAITFAKDGTLYIGTNLNDPVIAVKPDKSYEYFYPGLISPNVYSFAWGNGNILYYTKENNGDNLQKLYYIDSEKEGAPYYGRD